MACPRPSVERSRYSSCSNSIRPASLSSYCIALSLTSGIESDQSGYELKIVFYPVLQRMKTPRFTGFSPSGSQGLGYPANWGGGVIF